MTGGASEIRRSEARQGSTVIVMVAAVTDKTASEMVNWMVCAEVTDPEGTEMTQLPPNALSLY